MKSLKDRSTGKQRLPRTLGKNCVYHTWIFLLPMLIIACGGSLGKIQLENVNAVITQSESAIEQARLENAQSLAPEALQRAENTLTAAKEAVQAKDGLEAIHLAYDALTQAQIAEQTAMYTSQADGLSAIIKQKEAEIVALQANLRTADEAIAEQAAMYTSQADGLSAIIKRKEAEIVALQANLRTADEALEKSRTDIQRLDMQQSQLQAEMDRKIRELEVKRQQTLRDYNTAKTELALAQSMVEDARKEVEEARTKATVQAQSYSKQIERLDQSNVIKRRKDTLARKRREAKAYVQRQDARQPARTGRTSLTDKQIANGRAVISDWALAWAKKNINQHLSEYTQDAAVEQTVIHANSEKRTYLNRTQMADALKKMASAQWKETDSDFDADGESVIGTYRFSRLSPDATSGDVPALYDVWTREVWARQVGNQWKIFRETWRIYEAVPKYATIFN